MQEILEMLENKEFKKVREEILNINPADIAELMEELDDKHSLLLFRLLPKDLAVEVFPFIKPFYQAKLSSLIKIDELSDLVNELNFDDKIDLLEEIPANLVKKILQQSHDNERKLINQFLNYPEDSAGSLMTIEYIDLKKEMTAGMAIERIRKTGYKKETVYTCYVINNYRKLEGIISLRDIILADEDEIIGDLMEEDFLSIATTEDQEEVADLFKKYDLLVLPIVDLEQRLVGIITVDDIIDVIEEENTEDFHRMAALQRSERSYIDSSVYTLAKQRLPWLMILMISATLTGNIIHSYENTLSQVAALMVFIPMLMDTGGNAGSQSSTLIIRGMALAEVDTKDILKVIWKEVRISILVGFALSAVNFVRVLYLEHYSFEIALTVSITLLATIILAKLIGSALPIIAKTLKLDPAIMAGPIITTILDSLVLIIYFAVANSILQL